MASCEIPVGGEERMQKRRKGLGKTCIKCKRDAGALVLRGLVYCRPCTEALVVQRFRKVIDDHIPPNSASSSILAIAYSGGLGSTLLLELVANILGSSSTRSRKHRWDHIDVIYVDQSAIEDLSGYQGPSSAEVQRIVTSYPDFRLTQVPLEACFDEGSDVQPSRLLRSHIQSIPTRTGMVDSINLLTRRLLERTAKSLGATHLILGRNMSSLSIALLSNICSGRGASISDETVASWNGLLSFNPLRDLGSKECASYVYWNNLKVISRVNSLEDWSGTSASISHLTREFITGLERDYPSTVSTITKTCAKVSPRGDRPSQCSLCYRPMKSATDEDSQQHAVAILASSPRDAPGTLCYACNVLFTSSNSKSLFSGGLEVPMPIWSSRPADLE